MVNIMTLIISHRPTDIGLAPKPLKATSILKPVIKGMVLLLMTAPSPAWSLSVDQRVALLEEYVVTLKSRVIALEEANKDLSNQVSILTDESNKQDNRAAFRETEPTHFGQKLTNLQANSNF